MQSKVEGTPNLHYVSQGMLRKVSCMHSPKGRLARLPQVTESAMISPPGRMVQAACKEDEPG